MSRSTVGHPSYCAFSKAPNVALNTLLSTSTIEMHNRNVTETCSAATLFLCLSLQSALSHQSLSRAPLFLAQHSRLQALASPTDRPPTQCPFAATTRWGLLLLSLLAPPWLLPSSGSGLAAAARCWAAQRISCQSGPSRRGLVVEGVHRRVAPWSWGSGQQLLAGRKLVPQAGSASALGCQLKAPQKWSTFDARHIVTCLCQSPRQATPCHWHAPSTCPPDLQS